MFKIKLSTLIHRFNLKIDPVQVFSESVVSYNMQPLLNLPYGHVKRRQSGQYQELPDLSYTALLKLEDSKQIASIRGWYSTCIAQSSGTVFEPRYRQFISCLEYPVYQV